MKAGYWMGKADIFLLKWKRGERQPPVLQAKM